MKFLAIAAVVVSFAASVSGFTSYRPVYERELNRKIHLPIDYSTQAQGYNEDAVLARRNFERRATLFDDSDAIYRRAPRKGYVALIARAAAKGGRPSGGSSSATGPSIPTGKDATKLHVWTRLDTRESTFDNRNGASHDGLNQLMKDTGGRHVAVIVGNPSAGFHEYGLKFDDESWQTKPNGDGAPMLAYDGEYSAKTGETFTYRGQLDGRSTTSSVHTKAKALIKNKTYHHTNYNCKTFADNLVAGLNIK
ncbi:hypothetical protein MMC30_009401 [Trapelia coarctata]|nr:hypothetical protein [Trapelia coarctata]